MNEQIIFQEYDVMNNPETPEEIGVGGGLCIAAGLACIGIGIGC